MSFCSVMAEAAFNLGSDVQDLSLKDHLFLENLEKDVDLFCKNHFPENQVRALVFPPLTPRYRFLLHKYIEVFKLPKLQTVSVGKGYNRRPVIYEPKRNVSAIMASSPSVKNNSKGATPAIQIYRPPAARNASSVETKKDTPGKKYSKNKRPDMALYVPKSRRSGSVDVSKPEKPTESCIPTQESYTANTPTVPSELTADNPSPKKVEMVLEKESVEEPVEENEEKDKDKRTGVQDEDVKKERDIEEETFRTGCPDVTTIQHEKVLEDIPILPKDVDISDVLGVWNTTTWSTKVRKVSETQAPDTLTAPELSPVKKSISGEIEQDSWDALYDENGELLETEALEELTLAVGQVSVLEKPASSYENFVDDVTYKDDDDMNHILEIYDFPASFKTEDLFCILGNVTSSKSGFDIRWVDDTHALVVFASHSAAKEAQAKNTGLAKLRPLSQATRESRLRVKKMSDSLTPWKPRPQTSISMARRMVTSALGLRSALTPAQRQKDSEEKRKLAQARADRKLASQQREDAWEGHIS